MFFGGRDFVFDRFQNVKSRLRQIIMVQKQRKDKAAHMFLKVENQYEEGLAAVVRFSADAENELKAKDTELPGDMEVKDLETHSMLVYLDETDKLSSQLTAFRTETPDNKSCTEMLGILQQEVTFM